MQNKIFYPDTDYNRSKRRQTLLLSLLIIFFGGGTALTIAIGGEPTSIVLALVMGVLMMVVLAMVPQALKQYPTKKIALLEIAEKQITIQGQTIKLNAIKQVRMTVTLGKVGNDVANKEFIKKVASERPDAETTGDIEIAYKDIANKNKVAYATIANCYDAIETFYKLGIKHVEIAYSLKKLYEISTYKIGEEVTEDGVKLSQLSKKDRAKQLI